MTRPGRVRTAAGATLAIAGGFLMVAGGIANHSFLLSLLNLAGGELSTVLGGLPGFVTLAAITAVATLIGLGGFTVMSGGVLLYFGHVTTGRLLIALGGGAGFFGLLASFGYAAYTTGLQDALSHSVYWAGLIIAMAARRISKAPK